MLKCVCGWITALCCVVCWIYLWTSKPNIDIRASRHSGEVEENDTKIDRGIDSDKGKDSPTKSYRKSDKMAFT